MKIIDLLNRIAKGEEVPKKIKVGNKIYNYETFNIGKGNNYFTAEWKEVKGYRMSYDGTYYYLEIRDYNLNDEVEILEEEPRDIEVCGSLFTKSEYDYLSRCEEEKKIPEKLEDISEIKCVGCKVEINIAGNKTLFDTDTPIVTEHCIYKINQLIKNQKKIIDYLKSKGE